MFYTWAVSSFKVLIRPQASVFFLKMISLLLLDQKCLSQAKLEVAGGKEKVLPEGPEKTSAFPREHRKEVC